MNLVIGFASLSQWLVLLLIALWIKSAEVLGSILHKRHYSNFFCFKQNPFTQETPPHLLRFRLLKSLTSETQFLQITQHTDKRYCSYAHIQFLLMVETKRKIRNQSNLTYNSQGLIDSFFRFQQLIHDFDKKWYVKLHHHFHLYNVRERIDKKQRTSSNSWVSSTEK